MQEEDRIAVCIRVRPPIGAEAYQPLCLRKAQNGQTVVLKPEETAANMGETAHARSGVFIRVFDDLFRYRDSVRNQIHIKITLSIIELYVDDVLDLLANKKKLKLRDAGEETFALGISLMEVESIDDVLKYFSVANEFRSVSATKMNESSSRSHALFFIDLYQFPVDRFPTCPPLSSLVDAQKVPLPQAAPGMPSFVQANSRLLLIGQASPPSSSAAESLGTLRFCDRVKGLQAPASAAFPDPAEEERFLKSKKANHQLCADLRIAGVLHYHHPVRLGALAAARGTSVDAERARVEEELRRLGPLRGQQEEDQKLKAYEAKMAQERDAEVEAFILRMNELIEEYEQVAKGLKNEKKLWKKAKEDLDAQVEAATHEAKKAKKARVKLQERILFLQEEQKKAPESPRDNAHSFDDPDPVPSPEAKRSAAAVPQSDASLTDEADEKLLQLVVQYGQLHAELSRLQMTYVSRLQATRVCRVEVRRTKMRSSAIVSEGTTIDDLLGFMISRAVDISEGNIPEKLRWTWADVDGFSTRLKDATELHPPLLPRIRSSMFRRPLGTEMKFHRKTFLSSDDSDEEFSHYPAETRRQRNMMGGGSGAPAGMEEILMEDMDDVPQPTKPRAVPAPKNFDAVPLDELPGSSGGYAPGEEAADDEGSSEDSGDDEGSPMSPAPVPAQGAWGVEEPASPAALPAMPAVLAPSGGAPAAAPPPVPLPVPAVPLPVPAPAAAPAAAEGVAVTAEVPAGGAAPGTIAGGEVRRRHRTHRRHGRTAEEDGTAEESLQPAPVVIHPGQSNTLMTDGDEAPEDDMQVSTQGAGESESVTGMIEEMKRRRRRHRKDGEKNAAESAAEGSARGTSLDVAEVVPSVSVAPAVPPPKLSKEEEDRMYLMQVYDSPTLVTDLIRFLRGGTVMLKHGRMGQPHRRLFWVCSARGRPQLLWMDPEVRKADRSDINLEDVGYIKLGCFSKVFKRHPIKPTNDAFFRCFTVGLKSGGRTVDIVADTVADYEAWVVGLSWMIGVDPCWGGKPDITKEKGFDSLTFFESNLCETNYIMPMDYLTLKKEVQRRLALTKAALEKYPNNPQAAQREVGSFHPPALNDKGAMYMTKGELRFLMPELKLDIFRISFIWIQFEQLNLIYDPKFTPATSFGVTHRE
eukprot:gene5893-4210_t